MRHVSASTPACAAARTIALFAIVAALAACGGGGAGAADDAIAESPAPAPGPAPAPAPTTAELSWTPSESPVVAGYRVYHGTTSGAYIEAPGSGVSAGNATSFTFAGLERGRMYYFAVTAIDAQGNESSFSNEATKLIQ